MLIPNKYSNLKKNPLILGADIVSLLKKKNYNLEGLFQKLKENFDLGLEEYYDIVTFLWMASIIKVSNFDISLQGIKK